MTERTYHKVQRGSSFLKFPEVGAMVGGTYLGHLPVKIRGAAEFRHAITLPSGELRFFPTNFDLNEKLPLVPVGAGIRVTFVEKTTLPNGRTLHIFEVESDQPQLKAPAEPDGPAAETEMQGELPF